MRLNHCWTVLHRSIFAALLLTLNADSEDCFVELKVHRNTSYKAKVGEELRINCTVDFCDNSPPIVTWYKLENTDVPVDVSRNSHIKSEWKLVKQHEGISFLIFQNILRSDSGVYWCQTEDTVSHNIDVSVYDDGEKNTNGTNKNDTNSRNSTDEPQAPLWMYAYTAAGIAAFVFVVIIISILSMRGCKGKPKKEPQTENQYVAIPMVEQAFPHISLPPSPREIPPVPPSRRSTKRKTPLRQSNEFSQDSEQLQEQMKEDRQRQREEEGNSIVYVALNHNQPPRAAARPRRPVEETSEYAAIRVG